MASQAEDPADGKSRLALVIGNARYETLRLLANPGNDAAAMAERLKALGFMLIGPDGEPTGGAVLDLDEDRFHLAIQRFAAAAERAHAEIALIYYAGHGMQFGSRAYLLPVDVPKDEIELVKRNSIALEWVLKRLDDKAELTVAIFDACREIPELEDTIATATRDAGLRAPDFRGLARVQSKGRSRIVAYSAAAGQLAADGSGTNSPYTELLLGALAEPNKEVGDLFRDVAWRFGQVHDSQQPELLIQGVPSDRFFLNQRRLGSLQVSVTAAAQVAVNGREIGEARPGQPLTLTQGVPVGEVEVKVAAHGYASQARQVTIPSGGWAQVHFAMALTPVEMVEIPAGCFLMGSPPSEVDWDDDEHRRHQVCVESFKLAKHELTVGEFKRFVSVTGYRTDAERNADGKDGCLAYDLDTGQFAYDAESSWRRPNRYQGQRPDHPIACVSWNDAQAYIAWLNRAGRGGYRLPTEAEWEYAARAGTQTARFWGDEPDEQACRYANVADEGHGWTGFSCDDGAEWAAPVDSLEPNAWDLHDMLGNVWEWTCSEYDEDYGGAEQRCLNKNDAEHMAIRGGAWDSHPRRVRAASRGWSTPGSRNYNLGFRLAQDKRL